MRPNERESESRQSGGLVKLEPDPRGVVLPVRAQAGARRNGVLGARAGMLRVAVTSAPEKGKANKAIADVLSNWLDVPKSAIVLLSGETAPRKKFLIVGGKADEVRDAIAATIGNE